MPNTGDLGFAPVLHNLTAERVVFCYRDGDADSLDVANHYKNKRELPSDHLIALPCARENFIDESEYLSTIEGPLQSALSNLGHDFSSGGGRDIWVIILGFNVPVGFYSGANPYDPYDPGEVVAVASRLHRLGHAQNRQHPNITFDRRGDFRYFDSVDASELYITAVINGPNKEVAKRLIDRSIDVDNQPFVSGKVFVDPYGLKNTDEALDYQADILDFVNNELPNLGLESSITVDTSSTTTEPTVDFLRNDSFYWGWYTPTYSKNLFLNQNERRVFLYNADDTAASTLMDNLDEVNGSDTWCTVAIQATPSYAACAGSIAAPGIGNYLKPRPFFEALHRGATIGEAFLFSSKVVDWRVVLIGDPLMVVNFPNEIPFEQDQSTELISSTEAITRIIRSLEEALAWGKRQTDITQNMVNYNVGSVNISEQEDLLYGVSKWRDVKNRRAQNNLFNRPFQTLIEYVLQTTGLSLSEWLSRENLQISRLFDDLLSSLAQGQVESSLVYDEGHWDYTFTYIHNRNSLENVHFAIEVSPNENFSNVIIEQRSFDVVLGWKYESEKDTFVQLPSSGFPSNFSGRRVRFQTDNQFFYLTTGEVYYVRWRALDDEGVPISGYTTDTMIIQR